MRTTVAIPDELFQEAKCFVGKKSFSHFVRDAVQHHVERLKMERLAREMEEGYRAEAQSPSLDADWSHVEVEGWS